MAEPKATQDDHDSSTDCANSPLEPTLSVLAPEEVVKRSEVKRSPTTNTEDDNDASSTTDDVNHEPHFEPDNDASSTADDANHEPHVEPVVFLPELQEVRTLEEDEEEEELFRTRAKLFRFDSENDPPEWKERGTGDVKLMRRHREKKKSTSIRLLMRREVTLTVCANHYICPTMELKANVGSDRAWVWYTLADFADGLRPRAERLAIRFASPEKARAFKAKFDEYKEEVGRSQKETPRGGGGESGDAEDSSDADSAVSKAVEKLEELSLKEDTTPVHFPVCIH